MPGIIFRKMLPADLEQVTDLFKNLWADQSKEYIKNKFNWKYQVHNPANSNLLFVAELDGKIVGFRGYVVNDYLYGEVKFPVAVLSDAVISPSHRREGYFKSLTLYSLDYITNSTLVVAILSLSSNVKTTSGYLKLGWIPFSGRFSYYYINVLKSGQNKSLPVTVNYGNVKVQISSKVDFELYVNFNKRNFPGKIQIEKTLDFYLCKYSAPNEMYYYCTLYNGKNIVNFIVVKNVKPSMLKIVEIGVYDIRSLRLIFKAIKKTFNFRILSLYHLEFGNSVDSILKSSFHFSSKNIILKKLFGMKNPGRLIKIIQTNVSKIGLQEDAVNFLTDKNNWIIQPVNADAF